VVTSKRLLAAALVLLIGVLAAFWAAPRAQAVTFPEGKRFAFSIVDDTDLTTLARVKPVYDALIRYGLRTTKTVWVVASNELTHDANIGDTLADPEYGAFVKDLAVQGFEIALHGVRGGSSRRADIVEGLETFRREIGYYPRMHVNHSRNRDNLYWDHFRFSIPAFRLAATVAMTSRSHGHDAQSEFFWGDVAQQRIRYVRQFTFDEINLLKVNPSLPFHRSDAPYVNYWFQTSNGANREAFLELLKPANLDRLADEGGVTLVYSHLGAGSFTRGNAIDPEVEARIRDLAARQDAWFAPASDILDFLRTQPGWTGDPGRSERVSLEMRFLAGRVLGGGS
jgi:hypothetical protein